MKSRKMQSIKAEGMSPSKNGTILGQFKGMCADADITNENGLDITREVWETVFASDSYKKGIELGHYIGFLGHPDDPGNQDFEHACIVMTEGHIENDGKVYGTFNLVDTPVGRIVKSFIDAGVTFGISVRGAGDIIDNSVDPDTFVFRGFDLVTFPAYKEAIPTFTEIAASSDVEKQKKYKAVCAAVRKNLKSITSAETLDIIQEQFAPQSEEYALLEDRKSELIGDSVEEELDISKEQLEGVMQLYLDEKLANDEMYDELLTATTKLKKVRSSYSRKLKSLRKITAAQNKDYEDAIVDSIDKYQSIKASFNSFKQKYQSLEADYRAIEADYQLLEGKYQTIQAASGKLKTENDRLITANTQLESQIDNLKNSNLKYKQRIEASTNDIQTKDSIISSLRSELDETVNAVTTTEAKTSNLDAKVRKLQDEILAATELIEDYQNAYASLYASALGVHLNDIRVTSSTSVKDLQKIIGSASNSNNVTTMEPTQVDLYDGDDDGLVTM